MRKILWMAIMAAAVAYAPGNGFGQRANVRGSSRGSARNGNSTSGFNYQDLSRRSTQHTERETRQKKEAEEAKKKAEEEKRKKEREDRMKNWRDEREKREGKTTTAADASKNPTDKNAGKNARTPGKPASGPTTTGGSYDPTTRQVTEVMLDAVKTQAVKFDRASAEDDPSIILLNPPRHNPADRKRAADFTGIGRPL